MPLIQHIMSAFQKHLTRHTKRQKKKEKYFWRDKASSEPDMAGMLEISDEELKGNYAFPGGSVVKNPPANAETQETQVWSLCREYPLEKEMATHSSILAWKILQTEEPGGLQSMRLPRVRHAWATEHALCICVSSEYSVLLLFFWDHSEQCFFLF